MIKFIPTWVKMLIPDPRDDSNSIIRQHENLQKKERLVEDQIAQSGFPDFLQLISRLNRQFSRRSDDGREEDNQPPSPPPSPRWHWYDARYMIATALGAPEPEWDGSSNSWWMDREEGTPLSKVESADQIAAIPIPDWEYLPQVQRMLKSRRRWQKVFPFDPLEFDNLGRQFIMKEKILDFIAYPAYIDMGIFLIGTTRFFTEIGLQSDIADALMHKCFELSTSFVDFLNTIDNRKLELLVGFAGDATCMLSPTLYKKYSADWDYRLFRFAEREHGASRDLPCNLHSCGPSDHLYESWGKHHYLENIITMQTRLIPGTVHKLRKNMPYTDLQLTIHPQHFDISKAEPEEVERVLKETIEGAEGRDLALKVFAVAHKPEDVKFIHTNLEVYRSVLERYH